MARETKNGSTTALTPTNEPAVYSATSESGPPRNDRMRSPNQKMSQYSAKCTAKLTATTMMDHPTAASTLRPSADPTSPHPRPRNPAVATSRYGTTPTTESSLVRIATQAATMMII